MISPEEQEDPDINTWPIPQASERIKPDATSHRITEYAKKFIVACILCGMSDKAINEKLRAKKFILPGEPDVSSRTLFRIRAEDECSIDTDLLSLEAQQVGYLSISEAVVQWAAVRDAAAEFLLHNKDGVPKRGSFGYGCKQPTISEVTAVLNKANTFLLDLFASDLPTRMNLDLSNAHTKSQEAAYQKRIEDRAREMLKGYCERKMAEEEKLKLAPRLTDPDNPD